MTGPEHYRAAERILASVKTNGGNAVVVDPGTAEVVAVAQVHATLAATAATVDAADDDLRDLEQWMAVTS